MAGYWEVKRLIRESQVSLEREWKELVAEAARAGDSGEEELEWDSYKKIKEQWRLEELTEERQRKIALRDSRKAQRRTKKPIIEAHRKAISDAIRAKWADPVSKQPYLVTPSPLHSIPDSYSLCRSIKQGYMLALRKQRRDGRIHLLQRRVRRKLLRLRSQRM